MKKSILIGAALLAAGATQAATVSWGNGVAFSADTDISANGTSVVAINGGGATVTLNGTTFTGLGATIGGTTSGTFYTALGAAGGAGTFDPNGTPTGGAGTGPYDALSSNYQNLVSSGFYQSGDAAVDWASNLSTFSGLTSGQQYEIQLFVYDGRNGRSDFYMELDGSSANKVLLNNDPLANAVGADGIGEYITGTFTADAATQSFYAAGFLGTGASSDGRVQINAIQLRAIPEPATLGLIGFIGTGLIFIRRRFMI